MYWIFHFACGWHMLQQYDVLWHCILITWRIWKIRQECYSVPFMGLSFVCTMFVVTLEFVYLLFDQSLSNFYHLLAFIMAQCHQNFRLVCQRSRSQSQFRWFSFIGHYFVSFDARNLKLGLKFKSEQAWQHLFPSFKLYLAWFSLAYKVKVRGVRLFWSS